MWKYLCACLFVVSTLFALSQANPPQPPCICDQPIAPGNCRGYFPRYAYDTDCGKCVSFIYGGCGGNSNNFETLDECIDTCIRWR